jgi:CheY-like chemotaxis protein
VPVRRLSSVRQLVMDAVHLARASAPTAIGANIEDDLCLAEVEPGQMGQVLHNILLNARQAMPEGGIIEVQAENIAIGDAGSGARADARVRISIRDYGWGIPASILPSIFDPYFSTKPGASGLGLASAYAIVAKHGGNLSVESTPGRGSVFTIDLPASAMPAPQESPPAEVPVARRVQPCGARLLVMDDEESLRNLLEAILSSLGYIVNLARDGAEAIALCEKRRLPAVILMQPCWT